MTPEGRLCALPIWPTAPSVRRLPAGRTNANFVVECGGQRFFARHGVDLPHHGIDRRHETRLATLAGNLGIGPTVRHAGDGLLVTDFVGGRTLEARDLRSPQMLRSVAELLRRLHRASGPAGTPVFDLRQVCEFYLSQIATDDLASEHRRWIARTLSAVPVVSASAFIHADIVPENLIDDGERLWLVDWEYAGVGDPATDLAILAMNADLDDQLILSLVTAHGSVDPEAVHALRPAAAIREALWTLVQMRTGGVEGDLLDYSRRCFARLGIPR